MSYSLTQWDKMQHEETMLQTTLDFIARMQPAAANHDGLLLLIFCLLFLAIILLAWVLLRQRQSSQPAALPAQPVQIHLHLDGHTQALPPADNRHMAALATRLQQEKRLALGGGGK